MLFRASLWLFFVDGAFALSLLTLIRYFLFYFHFELNFVGVDFQQMISNAWEKNEEDSVEFWMRIIK